MRRKRFQLTVLPLSILLLISGLVVPVYAFQFSTFLLWKNEVPPVKTAAVGEAVFTFVRVHGQIAVDYRLDVKDIKGVTAAHIHLGKPGKNGPVVVVLYSGPVKKGKFTGRLAHGKITGKELAGPLKGQTLGRLMVEIMLGKAYVNVHTMGHPAGELRGQLECPKAICPVPLRK